MTFKYLRPSCQQRGGCYFVRGEATCRNCGIRRSVMHVEEQDDIRTAQTEVDDMSMFDAYPDGEADLRSHREEV